MVQLLGQIAFHRMPLRVALAKRILREMRWVSYPKRLEYDAVSRPSYGFCIYNAALQAVALGYPKISVIEFGVAGGRGLVNIEWHVQQIQKVLDVEIEAYGFDLGSGLPKPSDYRDMPYAWAEGFFKMDRGNLKASWVFPSSLSATSGRPAPISSRNSTPLPWVVS